MTRRFRCWRQGWAKRKQGDCGRTCATIVRQGTRHLPRCGSPIHRIARANTRDPTCATLRAHCRRMVTRALIRSTRRGAYRKPLVGRTCGESFTISKLRINPRLRLRLLERIAALYAIEKEIRGRPPDERREVRNTRSRPLLESLKQWFEETLGKLSRKSDTAMAVRYALGRWEALLRFCDDGRIEIDNNAAERALRVVALGRKNFLFAGSDGGGESAAAIYSLLGTAKLNGIDPESYLRNVLSRIADHPINHIEELLPWNVAASLQLPKQEAA